MADTTFPHGRLMLTVLDGLAEFERQLVRSDSEGTKRLGSGTTFHRFGKYSFQTQRPVAGHIPTSGHGVVASVVRCSRGPVRRLKCGVRKTALH
jgi:hypothetical protein